MTDVEMFCVAVMIGTCEIDFAPRHQNMLTH